MQRCIVISDLHLGGNPPYMMSQPEALGIFISQLPQRCQAGDTLELVINGDFIDFLAIPDFSAWTHDQKLAVRKLRQVMDKEPFNVVFDALKSYLTQGHHLTIILGNHDLELGLPQVQQALLERLGSNGRNVWFVDDGCSHRIGGLLIEHGNRYDPVNRNDWNGLREIRSCFSRGEPCEKSLLEISAGSRLVEKAVSPLKERYPFISLLQPEGKLTLYLLLALEPGLKLDLDKMAHLLRVACMKNQAGKQHARNTDVSQEIAGDGDYYQEDPDLIEAFDDDARSVVDAINTMEMDIAMDLNWLFDFGKRAKNSLAEMVARREEKIEGRRLKKLRVSLKKILMKGGWPQSGQACDDFTHVKHLLQCGAQTVVLGHTHHPCFMGPAKKSSVINTGAWTDVIFFPDQALTDNDAMREFLAQVVTGDQLREFRPFFAEIVISAQGEVKKAVLKSALGNGGE